MPRFTFEHDVSLDGQRLRFQSEPYRGPNQVAIAQDIFSNGVQLVKPGAIAHRYLVGLIQHRKRHRTAA